MFKLSYNQTIEEQKLIIKKNGAKDWATGVSVSIP